LLREPGEFIVDPWVSERQTLVAEQRQRVVAAAHLLRYGADERVSESYRDSGEIRWFLCWPEAPYWPDSAAAGDALAAACVAQLDRWRVSRQYADGALPVLGVYGVPVGFVEVDTNLEDAIRLARLGGWADVGNLQVAEEHRRRGIGTWLVGHAAEWLRLARVERILDYAGPEEVEAIAFLESVGFRVLTRTTRGWKR
jgi:ribosomal protein S18 acetylase RimI-like enzyme